MDLFDVAKACARRWFVFLPLCAIALFYAYHTYSGVQTVYYGSTTLGLASPSLSQGPTEQGPTNGLANTGGVTFVANLLTLNMSDASAREQVAAQGGLSDYSATVFQIPGGSQLPLVVISVTAADPAAVAKTLDVVVARTQGALASLQGSAGVPNPAMLTAYPVVPSGAPIPGTPSRMKSTVAILAAGLGLAVMATVLIDLYIIRRSERRRTSGSQRASAPESNGNVPHDGKVFVTESSISTHDQTSGGV